MRTHEDGTRYFDLLRDAARGVYVFYFGRGASSKRRNAYSGTFFSFGSNFLFPLLDWRIIIIKIKIRMQYSYGSLLALYLAR